MVLDNTVYISVLKFCEQYKINVDGKSNWRIFNFLSSRVFCVLRKKSKLFSLIKDVNKCKQLY